MSEITVHKSMGHFPILPENLGTEKIWVFEQNLAAGRGQIEISNERGFRKITHIFKLAPIYLTLPARILKANKLLKRRQIEQKTSL
jgi:hypothetical protein